MISTAMRLIMYGRCQVLNYYVLICTPATAISTIMAFEPAVTTNHYQNLAARFLCRAYFCE